jgi:hypothetical protein
MSNLDKLIQHFILKGNSRINSVQLAKEVLRQTEV